MKDWVPQARTLVDTITPWPVRAMRGLLDQEPVAVDGDELPLGWHWLFFKEALKSSKLGPDGHAVRGSFLPPVDLPRRMWAGGSLIRHQPVRIGRPAELKSKVVDVREKEGRSGRLMFVTVRHEVHQGGLAVEEEQSLVFREGEEKGGQGNGGREAVLPQNGNGDKEPQWSEEFTPTAVTLFQFSALTYNAHRIHYDHPYATQTEAYPGLLVHAPLTALVLLDAANRQGGRVTSSRYRALAPLFADRAIRLVGRTGSGRAGHETVVEAVSESGTPAMRAWIS